MAHDCITYNPVMTAAEDEPDIEFTKYTSPSWVSYGMSVVRIWEKTGCILTHRLLGDLNDILDLQF